MIDYRQKYIKYKTKYLKLLEANNKIMAGGTQNKELHHMWFKNWPDQGVPDISKVYEFVKYVYADIVKRKGNTVIHCAGGIGRTGTMYMILYLINYFKNNLPEDDVLMKTLKIKLNEARNHRPEFVEQIAQYEYIFRIVKTYLTEQNNKLNKKNAIVTITAPIIDTTKNQLKGDYCSIPTRSIHPHQLADCSGTVLDYGICTIDKTKTVCPDTHKTSACDTNECTDPSGNTVSIFMGKKNRFDSNPSSKDSRIKLCSLTDYGGYINADKMMEIQFTDKPNVVEELQIIATQAPIPATFNDFKKMIRDNNVTRIIMLTNLSQGVSSKADDYLSTYFIPDTKFSKDSLSSLNISGITKLLRNDDVMKVSLVDPKWLIGPEACPIKK